MHGPFGMAFGCMVGERAAFGGVRSTASSLAFALACARASSKMKVKVVSRDEVEYTRERRSDVQKVHRNLDPKLHPMDKAKECKRALNAAKMDRMFAKPLVGALQGHADAVTAMTKNPKRLGQVLSGSADGEIMLWDVPQQKRMASLLGHEKAVQGIAVAPDGSTAVSCSDDCTVRLWHMQESAFGGVGSQAATTYEPVSVYTAKHGFKGIDHHYRTSLFATAGPAVQVWDHNRSEPVNSYEWGSDSVLSVRFNPVEPDVLGSCGTDRSIALYDLRTSTPIRKLIMQTRNNVLCWNPMEAFNFTAANEDCNLYTYDMRKLDIALTVHQDHVSAVLDVDYSPTGREFVSGSYDRSVRIFSYNGQRSREVYFGKRMQRVFAVRYSGDGCYVLSGSDDMNVRVWKSNASQQLGTLLPREKHKHAYQKALLKRYAHIPEVRKIEKHRHVPKPIYKAANLRKTMTEAAKRKEQRRAAHSAPGAVSFQPARKKKIIKEVE